jgi:hypothetical protein
LWIAPDLAAAVGFEPHGEEYTAAVVKILADFTEFGLMSEATIEVQFVGIGPAKN